MRLISLLFTSSSCFVLVSRQSAVVPAPYGRWVEKLSWETKGTEEERQVGSNGRRRQLNRSVVLGLKPATSSERTDKRGRRHLGWRESARTSASRWSWWVYLAHLRRVWSQETEVCCCCFPLHGSSAKAPSRLVWWMWGSWSPFFFFFGYFKGWQC